MRLLETELQAGVAALGLSLSDHQIDLCLDYLEQIAKWNKVYNLTAVRDPGDMLRQHLLDSLALVGPLLRELGAGKPRLLDVGSGAGLPGVVIAIACPEVDVSCVDTVSKKAGFIQQVAISLRLPNLHGIHARVEELKTPPFDVVTSRAFASLADFVALTVFHVKPESGVWIAMKGKPPTEELAALPTDFDAFHVEPLQVPGLAAERCLVWIRPRLA